MNTSRSWRHSAAPVSHHKDHSANGRLSSKFSPLSLFASQNRLIRHTTSLFHSLSHCLLVHLLVDSSKERRNCLQFDCCLCVLSVILCFWIILPLLHSFRLQMNGERKSGIERQPKRDLLSKEGAAKKGSKRTRDGKRQFICLRSLHS